MLNTIKLLKSHKPLLLLYYLRNDRTCQFTSGVYEKQSHPKAAELHSINTQTHLLSVHLWHIEFLLSQLWGYETQKQTWDKSWKWINKWRSCLWEQHQSSIQMLCCKLYLIKLVCKEISYKISLPERLIFWSKKKYVSKTG